MAAENGNRRKALGVKDIVVIVSTLLGSGSATGYVGYSIYEHLNEKVDSHIAEERMHITEDQKQTIATTEQRLMDHMQADAERYEALEKLLATKFENLELKIKSGVRSAIKEIQNQQGL